MSTTEHAVIRPASPAADPEPAPRTPPPPATAAAPAVRLAPPPRRSIPDDARVADPEEALAVATALRALMYDGRLHAARAQANVPPRNALALLG